MNYRMAIILVGAFAGILQLAAWALDREPPFEVLRVEPVSVKAGDPVLLQATVRRDVHRFCSVTYSRHLYTPNGYRMDLEGLQIVGASQIEAMDRQSAGRLALVIETPRWVGPGLAHLVTHLHYRCNPLHAVWPIDVTVQFPFTVEASP